jgi:hypothetical protein
VSLAEVWQTYQRVREARRRKYPLIFYITMDNQVAVLLPYRIIGPLLLFRFQGQKYCVIYDKTKAVWFLGRPAIFVREGQLYPVDFRNFVYLQYADKLAPLYANALLEYLPRVERQEVQQQKAAGGDQQGQGQGQEPLSLRIREAVALLHSGDPIDKLNGIVRAIGLLKQLDGSDWLAQVPLDVGVLDAFRPREEDLNIIMAELESFVTAKALIMVGLAEVMRRPEEGMLRLLVLGGILLLGAWLFFSYVLPALLGGFHAAPPAPPAGVKVP